jgi:hypothetical protein
VPITVEEAFDSRRSGSGQNASAELLYIVRGTDDDLAARTALAAAAPVQYDGMPLRSVAIEPGEAPLMWKGEARYAPISASFSGPPQTGDSVFSFDTGGGSQHITQSKETVSTHAPPGSTGGAPDFGGAIGVTSDSVEGVDIVVPVYQFAETHYLPDAQVTPTFRGALFALTGRVNDAPFKGFNAGEVLFLGASGSKRGTGAGADWEIAFRFAASPNAASISIGDIEGISKKGWEYLWVRYGDDVDETADALVKRPVAAYVERVYDGGDFSQLGIGV